MRRMHIADCVVITMLSFVSTSHAGVNEMKAHWHSFWNRVGMDFHRNNAYPEPFRYADRQIVNNMWNPHIARGWQIENTLSDHHFDRETNQLTAAGQAKIFWIMNHAPEQRRSIFVTRDINEDLTETRVDIVQQAAAKAVPNGNLPPVVRTHIVPRTAPGTYVNELFKKTETNVTPVLPAASSGSGN